MTRDIRNPCLGLEQAPIMWNVAGLNWFKRSPTSSPLFELQHPPLYLISNSNLGINIQLKRSCKDLSPLKMFFGTIPTFLKGIIHNCGYWLITVFKILYGKHLLFLQFWSYSFNILYDVYTHNGGVHVHRILIFIKYLIMTGSWT